MIRKKVITFLLKESNYFTQHAHCDDDGDDDNDVEVEDDGDDDNDVEVEDDGDDDDDEDDV